jgi:hypothetical protein
VTTIVNATMFLGADGKPAPRSVAFAPGTYTGYALDGRTKVVTIGGTGSSASADATCVITQQPDRSPHGNTIRIINGAFATAGCPYIGYPAPGITVAPGPPPSGGFTQAQVDAAVKAAKHSASAAVAAAADSAAGNFPP